MLALRARHWLILTVCGGCLPPGTLVGPTGSHELRTAIYAVGIEDNAPEMRILLSNGLFECGVPDLDDADEQNQAFQAIFAAACREGAQHVVLRMYQEPAETWAGTFEGLSGASFDDVAPESPQVGRGAYYGIEEAFLVELDGLDRGYAAAEAVLLDDLGDGGTIDIDEDSGESLLGRFSFPDEQVSGEFRATRCAGDTQLLEILTALPAGLCQ